MSAVAAPGEPVAPGAPRLAWAAPRAGERLTLLVEPRFPGGTAAAVAAEIRALAPSFDLRVVALETAMFKDREVNPRLAEALAATGVEMIPPPSVIRADTVVLHNPACLKFERAPLPRISCQRAFVVTHENFLRPNGAEGFDIAGCLSRIDDSLVAGRRWLAPVSDWNRAGVADWLAAAGSRWRLADFDWANICDFDLLPPTDRPRDRRGRHSRPGLEKFPDRDTMLRHFPAGAEICAILGADGFLDDPEGPPRHWKALRFGETEVASFLGEIDFFVYFTNAMWRESFGRVIAEAIAAGKLVITDPGTAATFGAAVVASDGGDVDAIIARFIAEPGRYQAFVRAAQASLARFRPESFVRTVRAGLERSGAGVDVLV
ncbi:hypothetical protein [uncultured Amaricoccus sp.]|uniref:hypothetical protein n=1 Tax=uncultured Amaricoccus sp. TaxID=339341 RepID=UPI0026334A2C|nr:hypothetical protein [uncultured Amaricoccus sp.]